MTACAFNDGRRCRRKGHGAPPLCNQHREAIATWQTVQPSTGQGGIGTQLGTLLDSMLNGRRPNAGQVDGFAAGIASKLMGRPVTIEEVREIRSRISRGEWPSQSSSPSGSGSGGPFAGDGWDSPEAAQQRQRAAQEKARAVHEKKEKLRKITEARATLGFSPKEPVTPEMVKTRQRELAKKLHPDRLGGSTEKMQLVNAAVDVLLGTL